MKKIKRISAIILAMMIVLTGIYLAPEQVQEVQAADAATTYVVIPKASTIVTKDQESEKVTSVVVNAEDATYGTYADYLFAGWLKQDAETEEYVATTEAEATFAKFVSRDTLSVKLQIANTAVTDENDKSIATDSAIRFISSVDSLNYSEVGFKISYEDKENPEEIVTKPYYTTTVFEKIASTMYEAGSQKDYSFSPKVVGMDSEYFFTAKYAVAADDATKDYTVQAYWKTLDGTTVYGDARKVCVADNAVTTINMPVNAELNSNTTYTATGTNLTVTNVEVLTSGATCSSVRLTIDGSVMDLPSATKITFNDGTSDVATEVYRNYYTTHVVEGDSTAINKDTTWYEVYKEGTTITTDKFVIASSADLYGLAKIVNGEDADLSNRLTGKTITLIRDVEINSGSADTWEKTAPDYVWTPIGCHDEYDGFRGTFDGDDNTIKGLYYYKKNSTNWTETNAGLFGYVHSSSIIQNLRLTNSYIYVYKGDGIGGIVGRSNGGTIQNVYSSAIVVGDNGSSSIGQFVGNLQNGITIKNCWSDGKVIGKHSFGSYIGGFIGQLTVANKTVSVEDCLHTGYVENNRTGNLRVGGFFGYTKYVANFEFVNYMEAGEIKITTSGSAGEIIGEVGNASGGTATFTNTYAASTISDGTNNYDDICGSYVQGAFSFTNPPEATTLTALSQKTVAELFGENSCWEKVDGEKPFILSHFKDIWEDQQN